MRPVLTRRAVAEFVGTAFLVAVVIGSGIAAQRLSPGDVGLQLFENAAATRLTNRSRTGSARAANSRASSIDSSSPSGAAVNGAQHTPSSSSTTLVRRPAIALSSY